ncbi:uncharacterized protein (DUF1697 family) [Allocatelliglobosispora scoriae]|uniref:Uncharacterized protein (DUF1697 family) n=1 Tax=Allocatelliglobosispora scoriae TaxID=643052 RepID=A0A841BZC9_9ACTN|nr:DUF1697 domain-containing protein [Allocatelliglobosispora scoriae]MBB5872449.1 uncharacterized protein (DUF1697 family) [Allocatelliglobosispora scoriae]
MTRYAVLLRGINVGGNKKIAMADLRALLTGLGFTDVATLLQSGNAVITAAGKDPAKLAAQIEKAIADQFDMQVSCLIRTGPELRRVIAEDPFGEVVTNPSRYMVIFLSGDPDPEWLQGIDSAAYAPDEFRLGKHHEIYLWLPDGAADSKLSVVLMNKKSGVIGSARNWNTVTKLAAMLAE